MATEKEKLARWAFLDQLLSRGVFMSQKEIMDAYHGNPNTHINPISDKDTLSRLYLPSLRKDLDKFKSTLEKEGIRDMLECSRAEDDHRKLSYRYKKPGFSVMPYLTGGMTDGEYRSLISAINKLKSMLQNDKTFEEIRFAIQSRVEADYDKGPVLVDYEDNRKLTGREYRPLFYKAMKEKRALQVDYKTFKGKTMRFEFHPYLLKQYNERWFAFGLRVDNNYPYTSVPLDRLINTPKIIGDYYEERPDDYLDFFNNIIGVSKEKKATSLDVRHVYIRITDEEAWGRITTKPLPTQKEVCQFDKTRGYGEICLNVIPNPELYSKILSWGKGVVVISPSKVRASIKSMLQSISSQYEETY